MGARENIENDVINASYYPVVAVDPVNEHVYVAWSEDTAVKVKRWNRTTGSWEKTIVVESRGGPQDVTIGADAKGNVLLLWGQSQSSDSTLVGVWASRTSDGLAWSSSKSWFEDCLKRVSKSSPVRDAIQYGLNQWDGLIRFLDDGRIEINSNSVERSMRPIALNRKNSLFAGHDQGAQNWACLASLIETCKLNGVNPNAWLTDVLTKLVNRWPARRIDELMPWAYAATL